MNWPIHRVLLAVLLLGNAVLFAGVDPLTKAFTAAIVVVLMIDLRRIPTLPRAVRVAAFGFLALAAVQLIPLPEFLRGLIQPGFAEVMAPGWYSLSLAPWSTLRVVASAVIVAGIVLTAARMASTRSGLPALLGMIAATCGLLAVLGLAGESGAPAKVLLFRANTGGGGVYGPFVNPNHFAAAIELSLPAALVLLAAALRNLPRPGASRQRAAVAAIASAVISMVAVGAVLRSSSRGGVLFLAAALVLTAGLWMRPRRSRRWPWVAGVIALLAVAMFFASTRLPELRDDFSQLLVVEGVEGNDRWDLWRGTAASFARSPLVGSGLGSYRHVIALDKPATGTAVLEQAHNDWLEWASTTGIAGVVLLILFVVSLVAPLLPGKVRRLRFELRYPLAGAAAALLATALHETVGFGLQSPLNRYLAAVWVGLVWGIVIRVNDGRKRAAVSAAAAVGRTESLRQEPEAPPESVGGPISDAPSGGAAAQRGLFDGWSGGED